MPPTFMPMTPRSNPGMTPPCAVPIVNVSGARPPKCQRAGPCSAPVEAEEPHGVVDGHGLAGDSFRSGADADVGGGVGLRGDGGRTGAGRIGIASAGNKQDKNRKHTQQTAHQDSGPGKTQAAPPVYPEARLRWDSGLRATGYGLTVTGTATAAPPRGRCQAIPAAAGPDPHVAPDDVIERLERARRGSRSGHGRLALSHEPQASASAVDVARPSAAAR